MFLARIYGFLLPLETALATAPGLEEVIDIKPRAKAACVYHDLLALGMTPVEIAELPQCLSISSFRGPAAALGWMYVVERPMLANAVIRGHLGTILPVETAQASAYLCAYAGQAGTLWRELGEAMDKVAYTSAIADRIVSAAADGFRCLHRWRTVELTAMRIAG